jgi:hypothetical protein
VRRPIPAVIDVQPDDERPHHQNVMPLDPGHRRGEAPPLEQVEPLADLVQPLGRRRLEPDEDSRASRSRGQRQQLLIVGEVVGSRSVARKERGDDYHLIVVGVLILLGALPTWNHSRSWGYFPSGGVGLVLLVLVILLLSGRP